MNIKHRYQPTGNTCGPTCLYMVLDYVTNKKNDLPFDVEIKTSIDEISKLCGTDWIVGTPPEKMVKGMKALGIKHVEYMCSPRPYDLLCEIIDSGNIPILRTITKGVPHWIIVDGYTKYILTTVFNVMDPWLGKIQYDEKALDSIWAVRQHQLFEIQTNGN